MKKRKLHDGIVGGTILVSILLAHFVSPAWLWVPAVLGALLFLSAFTGFCPLYFILDKTCKTEG